ncbi:hypothetical protein TSUD_37220 [Trifolium subterraneum]|uniref:DUF4220 domain-containing protein n=1 Tax=Trifolium subterraneum TaxID=3900 RepID=A0A2Z6M4X8_TRISU|nr:hypothetical protein TSUD_37220 [Trifolium subterraneum]
MFFPVIASLIVYSRETISDNQNTPSQAKVWNVLELRILVAVSLFLQMILIFLGNRRKYIVDKRLKLLIWFTYLSADWIATVALGILSKDTKDRMKDTNFAIMAIWGPFLLVHLGGPDTITAYSLEDNQLWPRHLLALLYQLAVAVYIVYRSWNTNPLKYVTVPIVMAGIIKYGERTWSLRSGSSDGFRESILPPPDPGPNYAKFMDDYTAKKDEGYHVTLDEINETTPLVLDHNSQGETGIPNANIPDAQALRDGFKYYNIPECLFADLIFSFQDHKSSQFFFRRSNWKDAFKAIEVELGLIYDILYTKAVKLFFIYKFFEKSYYQKTKQVSEGLKELIFYQLKEKSEEADDIQACKKLCAHKGDRVLKKWSCDNVPDINRSIKEVEFDQSILLWHIATDLCYSSDDNQSQDLNRVAQQSREESRLLSDYMLNLLVICPFLLPNGIGQIRFEDTCAEVDELLKERKYIKERSQVCKMILRVNTAIPPSEVKGDRSKSVLFDACRLAKALQSLETEEHWSKERKWKMISNVWVEMLCHAASQCRGLNHAKQLSQGGELLTHVWLLMAHLGITEQFQISKGHVRAKLKLS